MKRPITPFVHGIVDYLTAGLMPFLPRVLGFGRPATCLMDSAGALTFGYSLVTRYPAGVFKMLPLRDHLKIDALQGGALITSSLLLDDEEPENRALLAGLGVLALAMSMLTQDDLGNDPGATVHPGIQRQTRHGLVSAAEHI